MLTKEYIENLKADNNGGLLSLTSKYKDAKNLSFILVFSQVSIDGRGQNLD